MESSRHLNFSHGQRRMNDMAPYAMSRDVAYQLRKPDPPGHPQTHPSSAFAAAPSLALFNLFLWCIAENTNDQRSRVRGRVRRRGLEDHTETGQPGFGRLFSLCRA